MSHVCREWREVLLPSPTLWIMGETEREILETETLPSFRFYLSKRRYAQFSGLLFDDADDLESLMDILNEYRQIRIQNITLGCSRTYDTSETWHLPLLNRLPSLQSLKFRADRLDFETNCIEALTALTKLEIHCLSLVLHENCFPTSLQSLRLSGRHPGDTICVEGLDNLSTLSLTSLALRGTFGREDIDYWPFHEPIWRLQDSLQYFEFRFDYDFGFGFEDHSSVSWPKEVSRLTSLTYLSLNMLTDYRAAEANISNLRNLQKFELSCSPGEPDGVPIGMLELPHLNSITLSDQGRFRVNSPDIWKIETLAISITALVDYDFSLPLTEEPRLKHLVLDIAGDWLPPQPDEMVNRTLDDLLNFLVTVRDFKKLSLRPMSSSGRMTPASFRSLVTFAERREDVEFGSSYEYSSPAEGQGYENLIYGY